MHVAFAEFVSFDMPMFGGESGAQDTRNGWFKIEGTTTTGRHI
jgi:hypothetical protein